MKTPGRPLKALTPDLPQLSWFTNGLIEILPAAVYVCDSEAVIAAFNKRAAELWGRTLKTPLIYQTGPKTSANSGCSRSI